MLKPFGLSVVVSDAMFAGVAIVRVSNSHNSINTGHATVNLFPLSFHEIKERRLRNQAALNEVYMYIYICIEIESPEARRRPRPAQHKILWARHQAQPASF